MFSRSLALTAWATTILPTAFAQSSTSTSTTEAFAQLTTADLLLGTLTQGFSGTVVSAAPCETVFALTCSGHEQCADEPVTLTATQGPTSYAFNFYNSVHNGQGEGEASMSQSCSLENAHTAVCNMYESISHNGRSSTTRRQTTLSGEDLVYAQVPITGGVQRLAEVTGSCSTATAFASRTDMSAGAARSTSVSEVVKVVVPIGMAVVGALL